jgi:hypothetical protein
MATGLGLNSGFARVQFRTVIGAMPAHVRRRVRVRMHRASPQTVRRESMVRTRRPDLRGSDHGPSTSTNARHIPTASLSRHRSERAGADWARRDSLLAKALVSLAGRPCPQSAGDPVNSTARPPMRSELLGMTATGNLGAGRRARACRRSPRPERLGRGLVLAGSGSRQHAHLRVTGVASPALVDRPHQPLP